MNSKIENAIVKGNSKIAIRLMNNAKGSEDYNILDIVHEGETIPTLHLAAEYDKDGDIIKYLLDSGADIERHRYQPVNVSYEDYVPLYNKRDCSALTWAILSKNMKAVEILLDNDADPAGRDDTLDKPVITSIFIDDEEDQEFTILIVSYLLVIDPEYDILDNIHITKNFKKSKYFKKGMDYPNGYFCPEDKIDEKIKFIKCMKKIFDEAKAKLENEKEDVSIPSDDDNEFMIEDE